VKREASLIISHEVDLYSARYTNHVLDPFGGQNLPILKQAIDRQQQNIQHGTANSDEFHDIKHPSELAAIYANRHFRIQLLYWFID
jgi:hypothetical protein